MSGSSLARGREGGCWRKLRWTSATGIAARAATMVLSSRAVRYSGTCTVKFRAVVSFVTASARRSMEMRCVMGGVFSWDALRKGAKACVIEPSTQPTSILVS